MNWQFIHIPKCGGMSFRKAYADMERQLQPTHDPAYLLAKDVRTVAVIRHPLDRFVSMYAHASGSMDGFRGWVDSGRWLVWPWIEIDRQGDRRKMAISSPQVEWLREDTYLIRFEHYQADLYAWAECAGVPARELPHRNVSKGRDGARWDDVLREDQAKMLWDFYAEDFGLRRSLAATPLAAEGLRGADVGHHVDDPNGQP